MNMPIGRAARELLLKKQAEEKRAQLLGRCRALMISGHFQPTATEIAGAGAQHDITNRFGNLPTLYEESLDDDTVTRIAAKIFQGMGQTGFTTAEFHRIARAAVFGRLST